MDTLPMNVALWLAERGACESARLWVQTQAPHGASAEELWHACLDGAWILWAAVNTGVPDRVIVQALISEADSRLHFLPDNPTEPVRAALGVARLWVAGNPWAVRAALAAAHTASAETAQAYDRWPFDLRPASYVGCAITVILRLAEATMDPVRSSRLDSSMVHSAATYLLRADAESVGWARRVSAAPTAPPFSWRWYDIEQLRLLAGRMRAAIPWGLVHHALADDGKEIPHLWAALTAGTIYVRADHFVGRGIGGVSVDIGHVRNLREVEAYLALHPHPKDW